MLEMSFSRKVFGSFKATLLGRQGKRDSALEVPVHRMILLMLHA